jgi:hypothetical protein
VVLANGLDRWTTANNSEYSHIHVQYYLFVLFFSCYFHLTDVDSSVRKLQINRNVRVYNESLGFFFLGDHEIKVQEF